MQSFESGFLKLTILYLRLIHVGVSIRILFLFIAEKYSIIKMCHGLFINQLKDIWFFGNYE